jgi:hypothetical protein
MPGGIAMKGLTQRLEVQPSLLQAKDLFCDVELSEQQSLAGGMGIDLGLPVGLDKPRSTKDGVLGVTKDGYEFTQTDLFQLIARSTGVMPPASVASVERVI